MQQATTLTEVRLATDQFGDFPLRPRRRLQHRQRCTSSRWRERSSSPPRPWRVSATGYVLALLLIFGSYYVDWTLIVFPVWVLPLGLHILIDNLRGMSSPATDISGQPRI